MSIAKCLPLLPEMNHWQTWKAKKLGSAQNISNVLPSLRHKTGLAMSFFEIGQNCLTFKKEQPWAKTVKQNKLIILFVGHCLHCAICCFAFLIAGCWLTCSTVSSRLTSVIEFASHTENNALCHRLSCLSISTIRHLYLRCFSIWSPWLALDALKIPDSFDSFSESVFTGIANGWLSTSLVFKAVGPNFSQESSWTDSCCFGRVIMTICWMPWICWLRLKVFNMFKWLILSSATGLIAPSSQLHHQPPSNYISYVKSAAASETSPAFKSFNGLVSLVLSQHWM